jgi:hypothetical protein
MNTIQNAALRNIIRRERLEHTIALAEGISDFIVEAMRYFNAQFTKAGEQLDQMSPYLPRSQA